MKRIPNKTKPICNRPPREMRRFIVITLLVVIALNGAMVPSANAQCGNSALAMPLYAVSTDLGNQTPDTGEDMAVQPDGKIIVAGQTGADNWNFAVARYQANGTLDQTFGSAGIAKVDFANRVDLASGMALQSNGKIVVVGRTCILDDNSSCNFAMTRLNANGTRDLTFGGFGQLGKVTTDFAGDLDEAAKVALQTDGKIVLAGRTLTSNGMVFAVTRYLSDGTLDTSFGGDGKATFAVGPGAVAYDLAIQPDGKIVVVGIADSNFRAIRVNANGTIDSSFGPRGKVSIDFNGGSDRATSIGLQDDGKIVIGGSAQSGPGAYDDAALVRLNANGFLDSSFDGDGKFTQNFSPANDVITDLEVDSTFGTVTFVANSDSPHTFTLASYYPSSIYPGCVYSYSSYADDWRQLFGLGRFGSKIYAAGYNNIGGPADFFLAAFETDFPM